MFEYIYEAEQYLKNNYEEFMGFPEIEETTEESELIYGVLGRIER